MSTLPIHAPTVRAIVGFLRDNAFKSTCADVVEANFGQVAAPHDDMPDFEEVAVDTLEEHKGTLTPGVLAHELAMAYEAGQVFRGAAVAGAVTVDEALAMLRSLEWSGDTRLDYDITARGCPACGGVEPTCNRAIEGDTYGAPVDHLKDCKLDALLKRATGNEVEVAHEAAEVSDHSEGGGPERSVPAPGSASPPRDEIRAAARHLLHELDSGGDFGDAKTALAALVWQPGDALQAPRVDVIALLEKRAADYGRIGPSLDIESAELAKIREEECLDIVRAIKEKVDAPSLYVAPFGPADSSCATPTEDSAWATRLYLQAFPGAGRVPEAFQTAVSEALDSRRRETIEECAKAAESDSSYITAKVIRKLATPKGGLDGT